MDGEPIATPRSRLRPRRVIPRSTRELAEQADAGFEATKAA